MKEITITPNDLKDIEEVEFTIRGITSTKLDGQLKRVLDVVKQRKFTTYGMVVNKLNINRRSARNLLEALLERDLVYKQYAFIVCSDSVKRKTALYHTGDKDGKRKNGRKRNK